MKIDLAFYSDGTSSQIPVIRMSFLEGKEKLYSSWIILINSLKRQNQWSISKLCCTNNSHEAAPQLRVGEAGL
jgi:hypothetical protein